MKPVRFAKVVEKCGQPVVFLPLGNPKTDRSFMNAVREERVLTIKQEPTSRHKDFGVVGLLEEKFVTYLLFPKSLRAFADARIIGIKYDVLEHANVTTATRVAAPLMRNRTSKKSKPAPKPKPFVVRLRITTTAEKEFNVAALNRRDAELSAKRRADELPEFSGDRVKTEVLTAKEK